MVDFNDSATIATPAHDIVRVLILQARANFMDAWEYHNKLRGQGSSGNIDLVRARLRTLFYELQPGLKRKNEGEGYDSLYKQIKEKMDENTIEELFIKFNMYLDEIKLTRIDVRPNSDRTRWEEDNKAHDY